MTQTENSQRGIGGERSGQKRAEQTHCKRGHLLSGDNLRISVQGQRWCRKCRAMHSRNVYAARRAGVAAHPRTHCQNGHEYTPENTYLAPDSNQRYCRECRRVSGRRWLEQQALTELQGGTG